MNISLEEHFTYPKLLRFTIPTIIMMIVTSIYGVVDGLFVSNVVGKTAFAAVNLIMPFPSILGAVGFMVGTGGSALLYFIFIRNLPLSTVIFPNTCWKSFPNLLSRRSRTLTTLSMVWSGTLKTRPYRVRRSVSTTRAASVT